jgi:hypothetical protein
MPKKVAQALQGVSVGKTWPDFLSGFFARPFLGKYIDDFIKDIFLGFMSFTFKWKLFFNIIVIKLLIFNLKYF